MTQLHIRNIPDDLYQRLLRRARSHNRTLNAEVIALLTRVLDGEAGQANQGELLAAMRRRRYRLPAGSPDSTDLLREDRTR